MDLHGVPEKVTIDKIGAHTAALANIQADSGLSIEMHQSNYLKNLVEQDRRNEFSDQDGRLIVFWPQGRTMRSIRADPAAQPS